MSFTQRNKGNEINKNLKQDVQDVVLLQYLNLFKDLKFNFLEKHQV